MLCEYISKLLKEASNRIYVDLKEKDIQLLIYGILKGHEQIDIKLKYIKKKRI